MRKIGLLVSLAVVLFSSQCAAGLFAKNDGQAIQIPIVDLTGKLWEMQGRICRPEGVERPRLVVINHGSPPRPDARPHMALPSCDDESVQWFVHRRYAVVVALRLGYGATGGPWSEGYGACDSTSYRRAGLETAREIKTIVDYAVTLPGVDPSNAVVVGQSAGGWGTLAYDSIDHPNVAAFVNMAGGRGGHMHDMPNNNCHPENLVDAAGQFGRTASTPMLWIYAKNDSFFGPQLAAAMYQAFSAAGGKAEFVAAPAFENDGHHLFAGHNGSSEWGASVEAYLRRQSSPPSR